MLTARQQKIVSSEIRREFRRQRAKPIFLRKPREQIIAIGFTKAREIDPDIPEEEIKNPVYN